LCEETYNLKQTELVRKCEEPYREGLKERTSAGLFTENLLINFLREEFKGKLFFKGIKACKVNTRKEFEEITENEFKNQLSPQTDIICYTDKEDIWKRNNGYESISYGKVKFVIEVKKKDTIETNQIFKLINYYNSIPIFFISFRGTGSRKAVMETRFAQKISNSIGDRKDISIFMFSRQNSKESRIIKKKLLEGAPETIRIKGFEGQLEKLVKTIREIAF